MSFKDEVRKYYMWILRFRDKDDKETVWKKIVGKNMSRKNINQ